MSYGLQRIDHAVGNVPELIPQVEYMAKCLGALSGGGGRSRHLLTPPPKEKGLCIVLPACLATPTVASVAGHVVDPSVEAHTSLALLARLPLPGWHEFAEFTSDDVGTVDSGLNSMVRMALRLANACRCRCRC